MQIAIWTTSLLHLSICMYMFCPIYIYVHVHSLHFAEEQGSPPHIGNRPILQTQMRVSYLRLLGHGRGLVRLRDVHGDVSEAGHHVDGESRP